MLFKYRVKKPSKSNSLKLYVVLLNVYLISSGPSMDVGLCLNHLFSSYN